MKKVFSWGSALTVHYYLFVISSLKRFGNIHKAIVGIALKMFIKASKRT